MFVQRTARPLPTRHLRRSNRVAFTLLEVLLVLAILVVLASLAVTVFSGSQKQAKIDQAKTEVKTISDAANYYKLHVGGWPQTLDDLRDNVSGVEGWKGPYIKLSSFNDPWGQPYVLVGPDQYDSTLIISSQGDPREPQEISSSN
jgi:general secretion pathway protein G